MPFELIATRVSPDQFLTAGERPGLEIRGALPGEVVRLEGARTMEKIVNVAGTWGPTAVPVYSWAEFKADATGTIKVDSAKPLRGTWRRGDGLGVLYSMVSKDAPRFASVDVIAPKSVGDRVVLKAITNSKSANLEFRIRDVSSDVQVGDLRRSGLAGTYARPKKAGKFPLVIYLHGSEGASFDGNRMNAARFAHLGYAGFALSYSARPWMGMEGIPTDAVNVPIELLDRVRNWARTRPEIDSNRIAVYGVSKGAEMSLVAATKLRWIRAIVPCVGSDAVWEGYGREVEPGHTFSSWSWRGKPMSYVPYLDGGEFFAANPGTPASDWHRRSRIAAGRGRVISARIPVEKISCPILLLAGEKDEIWPSASMSRSILRTMRQAGKADLVTLRVFGEGSHQISGTGSWPPALYAANPLGPRDADPLGVAEATVDAWEVTKRFLRKHLR
jgi:dienelactone hydrolase